MRLCDEYLERMGLGPLFFRHASKFFLFFDSGEKLLSVKWISSPNSPGRYEFLECILGNVVNIMHKEETEWSSYESFLEQWLRDHNGFVFEKQAVFRLVWNFFVSRNDLFLSKKYDPFLIYSTLDGDTDAAIKIANDTSVYFWDGKFGEILNNYAYWLQNWH